MFDVDQIKKDFPIFAQDFGDYPLTYLDNAATTHKPQVVLDSIIDFYTKKNANVSRSVHFLGDLATEAYESSRENVAKFLNAETEEIIFTKNSTESLNLVALGWGLHNVKEGDVILTTSSEHNSSILPWKSIAERTGARLKSLVVDSKGCLRGDWSEEITADVKVVVLTHVSNVLGTVTPVREICKVAKEVGALVVVDGSQGAPHIDLNMKSLGCDFYAFSGHKMLGPLGIGVLWARKDILEDMLPMFYGGGTVNRPSIAKEDLREIPYRFESGTPNVAGAVGLSTAMDYLSNLTMHSVDTYLRKLSAYAMHNLSNVAGLKIIGPPLGEDRVGIISFYFDDIHSHDVASILSSKGIAVRSGLHCAMHLYKDLNLPPAVRASFYIYNNYEDIDRLVSEVRHASKLLGNY